MLKISINYFKMSKMYGSISQKYVKIYFFLLKYNFFLLKSSVYPFMQTILTEKLYFNVFLTNRTIHFRHFKIIYRYF
jgi:hypothetical protein